MSTIDWTIVAVCIISLSYFTFRSLRYMKGISDFLSAGRCAGRYLQNYAGHMAGFGAVSIVALFEIHYSSGFPPLWWQMMFWPISIMLTLSGYVFYRFRETRCMTVAQYYEVRYSKSLRIYAGIITWGSGVVNFGVFPAIACRFIVHFCGLPENFLLMGINIPTFAPIMLITLGMALTYTNLGGQVTVMVTDCVQGIFCKIIFVALAFFLLYTFSWSDISDALKQAPTPRVRKEAAETADKAKAAYEKALKIGAVNLARKKDALDKAIKAQDEEEIQKVAKEKSMLNPANTSESDFNYLFYFIVIFNMFYGNMSWQGSQAYFSSSKSPHESKMSGIIGVWTEFPRQMMFVLIPVCALAFMTLPKYAPQAANVHQTLSAIDSTVIAKQVTVSAALGQILPLGVKGFFAAAIIFFLITTQDTYLHSWGSIFIQDVVLPFRKKSFTPKQQIRLLRWSIFFVAAFAFCFSLLFQQKEYVQMFFAITGAIVSGVGVLIFGGLYFKIGTTAGAWVAMTVGWVMAIGRIVLQQFEEQIADIPDKNIIFRFFDRVNGVNSQSIWFWIMISCLVSYFLVSLLTRRGEPFNMERMLHRGKYDTSEDHAKAKDASKSFWVKIIGITDEFTRSDRIIAISTLCWYFLWVMIFAIGTIAMFTIGISDDIWSRFWQVWVWVGAIIGIPITIFFTWGAIRDIKHLFAHLATDRRDVRDDGRVVDHHSVVDEDVE